MKNILSNLTNVLKTSALVTVMLVTFQILCYLMLGPMFVYVKSGGQFGMLGALLSFTVIYINFYVASIIWESELLYDINRALEYSFKYVATFLLGTVLFLNIIEYTPFIYAIGFSTVLFYIVGKIFDPLMKELF